MDTEEQDAIFTGNIIRAFLTGGMRRRVFATFDRNNNTGAVNGETSTLSTNSRLFSSEKMFRRVSKAVGFNQVLVSAISSIDLAEICLYDPASQPGVRPIYSLYPCKAFRVYACQFMAGENLVEYQPAISIAESNIMRIRMDGSTPRLSSRAASSRLTGTARGSRDSRQGGTASGVNSYSYGVRVRHMEENLVIDVAKMESEKEFVGSFGGDDLKKQQSLIEAFAMNGQEESHTTSTIMRTTLGPGSPPGTTERLIAGVSKYQQSVEDSIRNELDSS